MREIYTTWYLEDQVHVPQGGKRYRALRSLIIRMHLLEVNPDLGPRL
jgi:hypothetical protein